MYCAGADYGARPDPARNCAIPRGRLQPQERGHGLLQPRAQGRLPLHLRDQDAQDGARRHRAPQGLHGAQGLDGDAGLLPVPGLTLVDAAAEKRLCCR